MKAIILARVSTEEQKEAGNSLPSQLLRLEKYCMEKDLDVIKKIQFDESAWKERRKEFSNIIDKLKKSKEKVALCCDKIDRLLRNFTKEMIVLEELRRNDKLELHFPSENIVLHKESPSSDLFRFTIGVCLAKYYSDSISDNVKRAYEKMVRNGQITKRAPIGYINTVDKQGNKTVEIDPERGEHIKKIFDLYSAGCISMRQIAEIVDKDGLTSSYSGGKIKIRQIETILKNPFYYGHMRYKGNLYPHRYPKLVDYHVWKKCEEVRNGFHPSPSKHIDKPFVFRGLMTCARCGSMITAEVHKEKYVYYRCTNKNGNCKKIYVKQEELLKPVNAILQNMILPPKKVEAVAETLLASENAKNKFHEIEVRKLKTELDKVIRKQMALYNDKFDGNIPEDVYNSLVKEMEDRKYNLRFKLTQYENANDDFFLAANQILMICTEAGKIFENSDISKKREMVKLIFQNLKLDGKKLQFKLKTPFEEVLKANGCHNVGPLCDYFRKSLDFHLYLPDKMESEVFKTVLTFTREEILKEYNLKENKLEYEE